MFVKLPFKHPNLGQGQTPSSLANNINLPYVATHDPLGINPLVSISIGKLNKWRDSRHKPNLDEKTSELLKIALFKKSSTQRFGIHFN